MDRETVIRVARSAHLELTEEEIELYRRDLEEILDYFRVLDDAPSSDDLLVNPVEVTDVLRSDEPHMEIPADTLLEDVNTYERYVRGPRVQ
ncbi:MAG: Asp-tRNA(Asn)/Glu-tRNA(Gln) amidotransferase GatCAB subunit C [Thermoplasmatales archaeon]|jgi:aspartyl-tRNA(Asn)/glutamyl-tRNA(Gln) amidotransferase subunit C|nr:Asp-tRNA(Asn)/Glu-tRNA(Gln) amidotransferase GatCAB subunit C [Thermoplasmatales archaeon]